MATRRTSFDLTRPYLVIPKLIEQPTWGGQYIVATKGWDQRGDLGSRKIGQSYELFSGSNLSLLTSSESPAFEGELTNRDAVQIQTHPKGSIALADLLAFSPEQTLGKEIIARRGASLDMLIKFTQALGNSFQVHVKAGAEHPIWKPKPESWYYFEPGLITLGIKKDTDWNAYEKACKAITRQMNTLGAQVANGAITYEDAQVKIRALLKSYDPWQYVNTVPIAKDEVIDLSRGGIHHSWEEDRTHIPLGNVLYEIQSEAMDDVSTCRSFDKGKMEHDGKVRDVHTEDYFEIIDRSPDCNDPARYIRQPKVLEVTPEHQLEQLLDTPHYSLNKLTLRAFPATYTEALDQFRHLFIKSGKAEVSTGKHEIIVSVGHSCFIPAAAGKYTIRSLSDSTEVLISY